MRWKLFLCAAGLAATILAGCRKSESRASGSAPAASETALHPPFGVLDTPKENDTVASGSWAYGWALDDSGVARVEVSLDNGPATPAAVGQSFPGVREAYPNFPNADKAGFSFPVPSAVAGPHLLIVTIMAKDGGRTKLTRHLQIK